MKSVAPLALTIVVSFASSAAAEGPPAEAPLPNIKTLVMELEARRDVDPALTATMTDVVQTELSSDTRRTVFGKADLAAILELEADKASLGCTDSSCLSELASAMDVDTLITGNIDVLGEGYLVTLAELDARTIKPMARVQGNSPKDEGQLFSAIKALVKELADKTAGKVALYGEVEITTVPSGLAVRVGNKDLGLSPASGEVPVGTHRVTVISKEHGATPVSFDIVVARKKQSKAEARLFVPGEVDPKERERYETRASLHPWLMTGKICGGLPGACVGIAITPLFAYTAIQSAVLPPGSYGPAYTEEQEAQAKLQTVIFGSVVAAVSAAIGVGGFGLVTWGAVDAFSWPEEPTGAAPMHHITVTPAEGDPTFTKVPTQTETAMAH